MKWKIFLAAIVFVLVINPASFADTIFLRNGKIIEAEIVENTGYAVRIKKDGGIQTIFGTDIIRIVKEGEDIFKPTAAERLTEAQAAEKKELILRLFEANNARESINMLFQQLISKAPPETHEELKNIFKTDEILERVVPIYEKYYKIEELKEIINFYKSPAGQKHLAVTPYIMEESIKETYKYFQEKGEAFTAQMKAGSQPQEKQ